MNEIAGPAAKYRRMGSTPGTLSEMEPQAVSTIMQMMAKQQEIALQNQKQLNSLLTIVSEMSVKFDKLEAQVKAALTQNKGVDVVDASDNSDEYAKVCNVDQLIKAAPWATVTQSGSQVEVKCNGCFTCEKEKLGYFKISAAEEQGKRGKPIQTQEFRSLKKAMKAHAHSYDHLSKFSNLIKLDSSADPKQDQAALNCGVLVWSLVKKFKSLNAYEDLVSMLTALSVPLGDINHSRKYAEDLVPEFYNALKCRMIEMMNTKHPLTNRKVPFTVWCDKVTPNGTTLQVIGICTNVEGYNRALLLDNKALGTVQDALTLADDIVNVLCKFYSMEDVGQLLMGFAVDGQYIKYNVPLKSYLLLGFDVDDAIASKEANKDLFHHQWWDTAHQVELANSDISKECPWVKEMDDIVKHINGKFRYGKGKAELHSEAAAQNMRAFSTGSNSDTRFAAHEFKVLKRFYNNYQHIFNVLSRRQEADLCRINNFRFAYLLSGMADFYKIVGSCSIQVQSSTAFPWETDCEVEKMIASLVEMSNKIVDPNYDFSDPNLSFWNETAKEALGSGTFQGKALLRNRMHIHNVRSREEAQFDGMKEALLACGKLLNKFYDQYHHYLKSRLLRMENQPCLRLGKDCFSLYSIIQNDSASRSIAFRKYYSLAREWEFVEDTDLDELTEAYMAFTDFVSRKYSGHIANTGQAWDERDLWHEILTMKSIPADLPVHTDLVMHLLLTSLVRNKSECIAETVGSLLKCHVEGRGGLSDINLANEVFLHFNGPEVHNECHELVRRATKLKFGDKPPKFIRVTKKNPLKEVNVSVVADRKHLTRGRVPWGEGGS